MAKRSPPMPFEVGSITPWVELAAMAASTALPPRARICTAAWAARGWLDAATPCCDAATDRPGMGKAAARESASVIMADSYHFGALRRCYCSPDAQGQAARRHRGRHGEEEQDPEAPAVEGALAQ